MKKELNRYIRKILQDLGTDVLKDYVRFYAYLMDLATEHINEVRTMAKYGKEDFLSAFYRVRKSSTRRIRETAASAAAELKRDTDIDAEDADYIAEEMGKGLDGYLHPDTPWTEDDTQKTVSAGKTDTGGSEKKQTQPPTSSTNRWVPIWEQPDQGITAVPRRTRTKTPQDEAEEELARLRQTKVSRAEQEKARRRLHEETVRMFTPGSGKFEFWNDTWNSHAMPQSGNQQTLQEKLQIVSNRGEVLRTVERGARLPLHLTIYPRGVDTFSEGVTIRAGNRPKYKIRAAAGVSEFTYLQFTYQADGSLTDVVLFGTMSRKTYAVDVRRVYF